VVHAGDVAEFSTMIPHSVGAHDGPVEILTIFDHHGERAHLHGAHVDRSSQVEGNGRTGPPVQSSGAASNS
jgi:hypothetical protein